VSLQTDECRLGNHENCWHLEQFISDGAGGAIASACECSCHSACPAIPSVVIQTHDDWLKLCICPGSVQARLSAAQLVVHDDVEPDDERDEIGDLARDMRKGIGLGLGYAAVGLLLVVLSYRIDSWAQWPLGVAGWVLLLAASWTLVFVFVVRRVLAIGSRTASGPPDQ